MALRTFEIDGEQYRLIYKEDKKPFDWQVAAFKKLVPLDYGAIFAEVGCGKSAELIYLVQAHAFNKTIDALFLIAPKSVYRQWATQQLPEHMELPYEVFLWGQHTSKKDEQLLCEFRDKESDKLKVVLVNVEAFSYGTYIETFRSFLKAHNTAYAIDEATRIKTPTAERTQNIVMHMNDTLMWRGRINSVMMAAKKRYILTGTPVDGSPISVYSMFNFLNWGFFSCNYTIFRQQYSLLRKEQTNGGKTYFRNLTRKDMERLRKEAAKGAPLSVLSTVFNTTETDIQYILNNDTLSLPWKNLASLKKQIAPCSYTITLDECFEDVPEETIQTLDVEMTAEQKRVYKMLKQLLYVELGGREMTVKNKLTLTMRLQQVTGGFVTVHEARLGPETAAVEMIPGGNAKYNVLRDDLEEYQDRPVIIFCRYLAEARFVAKKLAEDFPDDDVGLIIGEVKQAEREDILARFDRKEISFLVATPGCLSVGRNLQVSHVMYFFSLSFSSEEHLQAKGRIRRATQKYPCIYKYLTMVGTIDEHVVEVLQDKQDLLVYMQSHDIEELM